MAIFLGEVISYNQLILWPGSSKIFAYPCIMCCFSNPQHSDKCFFFFITVDECFISKLSKSSFITSQSYVYVNFFYTGSSSSNNGKANSQSTSKHWYPTPYFKNASDCWRETKSRRWISGEELHSTNFSGNYAANCLKFSLKNFVIVRYVQRWLSPHSEYTFFWNLMHSVFIMLSY